MTPFSKTNGNGESIVNWSRIIELIIIVVFNAAVLFTTLQVKIGYLESAVAEIKAVFCDQQKRVGNLERDVAILNDAREHGWKR